MKNQKLYFLIVLLFTTSSIIAQTSLKKVISFEIPGDGGSNSTSVIWHPIQKKYYTTMVGNATYQMAIFDAKGKLIEGEIDAEHDYRGLWYNPKSKRIEFNCYDSGGLGHLNIDAKGKITDKIIDKVGMNQPNDQSVGTYNSATNKILFYNYFNVEQYDAKTLEMDAKTFNLFLGCKTKKQFDELTDDEIMSYTEVRNLKQVIYTGLKGSEFAILNTETMKIEFYNMNTGLLTKTQNLPKDLVVYPSFNICYNNGIWWFFNKELRTWDGYK